MGGMAYKIARVCFPTGSHYDFMLKGRFSGDRPQTYRPPESDHRTCIGQPHDSGGVVKVPGGPRCEKRETRYPGSLPVPSVPTTRILSL